MSIDFCSGRHFSIYKQTDVATGTCLLLTVTLPPESIIEAISHLSLFRFSVG